MGQRKVDHSHLALSGWRRSAGVIAFMAAAQAGRGMMHRVLFRPISVRLWGWLSLPLMLVAFPASHGLNSLLARRLALGLHPWLVPGLLLLGAAFLLSKLSACPRCGRSSLRQSDWLWVGVWPVTECSKCGLDLRRAGPNFRTSLEDDDSLS